MSYQSKYTGQEIDEKLDKIEEIIDYQEVELLSEPKKYAFTSATSSNAGIKTINQDLVLTDSIEKYDELVFKVYKFYIQDGAKLGAGEIRFKTSNIVYHNSDQADAQTENRLLLVLPWTDLAFNCAIWFKNSNTIKIFRTETTYIDANAHQHYFQIESIKGIKYGCNNNNSVNSENIYSTEEQRIGTWINGKPLYQKTITGYKMPSGSMNISVADCNVELFVDCLVHVSNGATNFFLPMLNSDSFSKYAMVYCNITNQQLTISNSVSSYNDRDLIIIIKYTKTTD